MHSFVIKYLTQPKLSQPVCEVWGAGVDLCKEHFPRKWHEVLFGCLHYLHIFQIVFCIPTWVKSCKFKHDVARWWSLFTQKSESTFQIDQMPRRCRSNLLARHACISMQSPWFECNPPFNKPFQESWFRPCTSHLWQARKQQIWPHIFKKIYLHCYLPLAQKAIPHLKGHTINFPKKYILPSESP